MESASHFSFILTAKLLWGRGRRNLHMKKFETNPNFVPINSFYLLSDEEALKSDLAKLIFVLGKVQERYEGEDGIEHYEWNTIYVEVEVVQGLPYGKCKALTMGAEVLEKFYSKLN